MQSRQPLQPAAAAAATTTTTSKVVWTPAKVALALIFVASGAGDVLLMKAADNVHAPGMDGVVRPFEQPHLQTILVILSQLTLLVCFQIYRMFTRRKVPGEGARIKHHPAIEAAFQGGAISVEEVTTAATGAAENGHQKSDTNVVPTPHIRRMVRSSYRSMPRSSMLMPGVLAVFSNVLALTGLVMLYPSLYQMLMGSSLLFIALLSVVWAKRKLRPPHWVGLGCVFVGVVLAGLSGFFSGKSANNLNPGVGVPLVLSAQIFIAIITVYKDRMFLRYKQAHPLLMAGYQGAWGVPVIIAACIVGWFIPGSAPDGRYINVLDGFYQMYHSQELVILLLINWASFSIFNASLLYVVKQLSALHMSMINQMRTVMVWAVSYSIGWDTINYFQGSGFLMMMLGNLIFNEIITPPGMKKSSPTGTTEEAGRLRVMTMAAQTATPGVVTIAPSPTAGLVEEAHAEATAASLGKGGIHEALYSGVANSADNDDDEDDDEEISLVDDDGIIDGHHVVSVGFGSVNAKR